MILLQRQACTYAVCCMYVTTTFLRSRHCPIREIKETNAIEGASQSRPSPISRCRACLVATAKKRTHARTMIGELVRQRMRYMGGLLPATCYLLLVVLFVCSLCLFPRPCVLAAHGLLLCFYSGGRECSPHRRGQHSAAAAYYIHTHTTSSPDPRSVSPPASHTAQRSPFDFPILARGPQRFV